MDKVGLITLYRNNYGSALQCFSTMLTIRKLGYDPFLLLESSSDSLPLLMKKAYRIAFRSLIYKNYWHERKTMNMSIAKDSHILTEDSKAAINIFIEKKLSPLEKTSAQLTSLAHSGEWKYFITGSDQVWNASRVIQDLYLLRFAPSQKRVAFSASFGTKDVANFNIPVLKRELPKFRAISVREESGRKIVKDLTGREVERLADPVVLLTKDEWVDVAKDGRKIDEPYIFVHFLNEPNQVAVDSINQIQSQTNSKVFCLGYKQNGFSKLNNVEFVDGGPEDYLSLIMRADYICTDSFHTCMFSIIFSKNFYVFKRQYLHGKSQGERITDLLKRYQLGDRLIENINDIDFTGTLNSSDLKKIIDEERKRSLAFLESSLQ
jgi:hypothetical protein